MLPPLWRCTLTLLFLASQSAFPQPVQLVNAFPNLTFTRPLFVTHANDGSNRIFVVQQNGLIRVFANDSTVTSATTYLNITNKLSSTTGEEGLLGLAFHPDYATNGYFYVNYTAPSPRRTVVARYSVSQNDPNRADSLTEFIVFQVNQPYSNHNGGMVMFGLDGYLYIGMGDGGSAGDPGNRAQDSTVLLGKMMRINIDTVTASTNYGIPPDNPFVGRPGWREEIYSWGLRNPWRFSQDPVNREIWLGDVGQNAWEEIDLLGSGLNYGWRCYEGPAPYNTSGCGPSSLYTFPVKSYARVSPHCSVTGGYIYRGYRRPELVGRYVYSDYCSGYIWKFFYQNGQLTEDQLLIDAPFAISSFGVDQDGELYICNYATSGSIYRFAGNPLYARTTQVAPVNGSQNVSVPTRFEWRSAPGALNYWLDVATDQNFAAFVVQDSLLTDTAYVAANLEQGTRYYWRVKVKNAAGWGNYSSIWGFTTSSIPGPINLIEPPDGTNNPSRIVTFSWRSDNHASSYWFELGHDSTFGTVTRRDSMLTDTTLTINEAVRDTVYYWRVRGRSPSGFGPFSQVWTFTTYSLPAPPVLVSPADSSLIIIVNTIDFVWRSSAGASDYWFDLARDQSFQDVVRRDSLLTDTTRSVEGLDRPQRYFWRVRARSQYGYGFFSAPWTFFYDWDLGVEEKNLPKEFSLHQNYPNPFNPSTSISYDIPRETFIRLSIMNLLGQEVRVVYRGIQRAGTHSLEFDASGLSSGVYFYKLEAEGFRSVRKMILMR